jgi:hypothetical protein
MRADPPLSLVVSEFLGTRSWRRLRRRNSPVNDHAEAHKMREEADDKVSWVPWLFQEEVAHGRNTVASSSHAENVETRHRAWRGVVVQMRDGVGTGESFMPDQHVHDGATEVVVAQKVALDDVRLAMRE